MSVSAPAPWGPRVRLLDRAHDVALRAAGVLLFLGFWWVCALGFDDPAILPAPDVVLQTGIDNFGGSAGLEYIGVQTTGYADNIWYTVTNALLGWIIGVALGIGIGLVSARQQWMRNLSEPALFVFGCVPVLVASPFFLIWFGFSRIGQLALVVFYCFTVVAIVTQNAALSLAPEHEEYAASMGAGRLQRFRTIVLPACLPAILAGLRVALGTSWTLQTIAELLGSKIGVGRVITVSAGLGDAASMIAIIVALAIVALVFDIALRLAIRRVVRWQDT